MFKATFTRTAVSMTGQSCCATLIEKFLQDCVVKLKHPMLPGLLQLDCAVMLRCFNGNFSIEVA